MSELNIPDSVVEVSNQCFYNCERLKRVTFGESSRLERIGTICFALSGLDTFRMPVSVISVGGGAFNGCPLEGGFHCSDECSFRVIGNLLVDKSERVCISCLGPAQDIVIPDSVRELCDKCFYECESLTQIRFGLSSCLERIGAFSLSNTSICDIVVPDCVRDICDACFDGCENLEHVILSPSCKALRLGRMILCYQSVTYDLNWRRLQPRVEEISMPDGVVELCNKCFYKYKYLKLVRFGESSRLERIGTNAFHGNAIESVPSPGSVIELPFICDD